jgi:hypothetical protein
MTELELQLTRLGAEVEFPPTPDLSGTVRRRLAARPPRAGFPRRRAILVALVVLAVVIGAVMAVPSARTSILKWFHLRGVTVERVETLPRAHERSLTAGLGQPLTFPQAARRVGFRILLPRLEGRRPKRVYVLENAVVSALLGVPDDGRRKPVLLSEFQGSNFYLLKKAANGATHVLSVRVNGQPGLWLAGAPHVLSWVDPSGRYGERSVLVTGDVLLWQRGGLTFRLEGHLSKADALRLASTIR